MSRYDSFYPPYIPVAVRKEKAAKKIAALQRKGQKIEPVVAATPRGKIALSFWGQAWCQHLESYSDYSNRLPRGRSYLRNGSVLHLGVATGRIDAMVMGSSCYKQVIRIDPLPPKRWQEIKQRCQGKIGSLVELLQGKLSDEVMAVVTDRKHGLFPGPDAIHMSCSCPDWAELCKHLAAILYGLGARLDNAPELLFKLRGVDQQELIVTDPGQLVAPAGRRRRTLEPAALSDVFGIEIEEPELPQPAKPAPHPVAKKRLVKRKRAAVKKPVAKKPPAKKKRAAVRPPRKVASKKVPRKAARPLVETDEAADPEFYPIGASITLLRMELGLTRSQLAARVGVSAQTVANWEKHPGRLKLRPRAHQALTDLYGESLP